MAIHFFEEAVKVQLLQKRTLKTFIINQIKSTYDVDKIELNYIFCSDEALLERNIQFLQHDTYTDIITFDLSETEEEVVGEIYISVDRVKDNAATLKLPFQQELHRVIFHGVLHLLGYKDKTDAEAAEMRSMEDEFLKAYFGEL